MTKTIKDLEPFLKVLDIKELDKAPSFSDLRKAYRNKLHLHPDKAGKDSTEEDKRQLTEAFQEVSEAVHEIFFFLVENVDKQKKAKSNDEGTRLLKFFEHSCEMVYNQGSITFFIEDDLYDPWMQALEKKFGSPPEPLREIDGFFFRIDNLEVSKLENLGKVTASCWKKPSSDGRSKIVLQGKAYMSFFTLVIPDIIMEINKLIPEVRSLPTGNVNSDKSEKATSDKKDKGVNDDKVENVDITSLTSGFETLQSEVVTLRENLVGVIDRSVAQLNDSIQALSLKEDMENLGKVVASNTHEISSLQVKLDQIILNQQQWKPIDTQALDSFLSHSNTVFTKLEEVTSIHTEAGNIPAALDTKKIVDRLDEMAETTSEIKNEIKQLETKEKRLFKETIENCEQSIPILKAIEEKVNNLVTSLEAPLQIQPSVRPREPAKHASGNRESEQNSKPEAGSAEPDKTKTDKVDQQVEEEIVELRSRKCLFLSSSIGLGCNMEEMENRLDCEIIPIPTYHIEKRVGARDPELNLKENLKLELEKRKNIDLLIIATGSNDITFLDTKNKDVSDLITTACNQSREIVQLANEAAQKYDLDVFVVEKPPRDETTNNDPLSDCSISSNGLFHSL